MSLPVRALRLGSTRILFVLVALSFGGCESPVHEIAGPYRLAEVDAAEDTSLCYRLPSGDCVGRVAETVFAAGSDQTYVVAARHPHRFGDSLDRSKTEYYYIIRALDGPRKDPSDAVRGPFDSQAFAREKHRLSLPEFSVEISSLK